MKPVPCPKCKTPCDSAWLQYRSDRLKKRGGNVFQDPKQCSFCGHRDTKNIKKFPHVVKKKPAPAARKKNYRG